MASKAIQLVSFINRDEPAALGCTAAMSPDLPIPWLSLTWESKKSWLAPDTVTLWSLPDSRGHFHKLWQYLTTTTRIHFVFAFHWGLKNNSPYLHKKTTNWRILVVVVKWHHCEMVIILFVLLWIENIYIPLPFTTSLWMMLAWLNLWLGNFLPFEGSAKSQQSEKSEAKKEEGKKDNLITGQAWLSKGEKSNLQFCLTFWKSLECFRKEFWMSWDMISRVLHWEFFVVWIKLTLKV